MLKNLARDEDKNVNLTRNGNMVKQPWDIHESSVTADEHFVTVEYVVLKCCLPKIEWGVMQ